MSAVVISGDTSGTVTLNAPAVAGSTTITLPTVSGSMLTSADVGTTANKLVQLNSSAQLPALDGSLLTGTSDWQYIASGATLNTTLSFTNIGSYSEIIASVYFGNDDNTNGGGINVNLSSNNGSTYGANRTIIPTVVARYDAFGLVRISNTNVTGNKTISPFLARRQASITGTSTETAVTGTINALRFAITNSTDMVMAVSLFGVP